VRIREVSSEELDFVSAVCLDPSRGVARALMERCIENARAHGGVSVLAYDGDKWFRFWGKVLSNNNNQNGKVLCQWFTH